VERSAEGRAGPGSAEGRSIKTHQTAGGTRVSTIRRPDGSTLTVRVPMAAMDDEAGGSHWPGSWITADGAAREPSASALRRLASVVTVGPSPCRALPPGIPPLAVR
jgi:hypothetical protein